MFPPFVSVLISAWFHLFQVHLFSFSAPPSFPASYPWLPQNTCQGDTRSNTCHCFSPKDACKVLCTIHNIPRSFPALGILFPYSFWFLRSFKLFMPFPWEEINWISLLSPPFSFQWWTTRSTPRTSKVPHGFLPALRAPKEETAVLWSTFCLPFGLKGSWKHVEEWVMPSLPFPTNNKQERTRENLELVNENCYTVYKKILIYCWTVKC